MDGASLAHPSGRQYEIAHGDQRAVAVEVGGGLRRYSVGGFDVLDGYGLDEVCDGTRGQPLLPWPNRIRDGRYAFAGEQHQLALTEPAQHNAIHGLLRWVSWRAAERSGHRVRLECALHPRPGYPFSLLAAVEYELGPEGLRVTLSGRNLGATPLPFGAGQHPYLRVGEGTIDGATVQAPARTRLVTDERGIPTGERVPVAGDYDLREPRRLGARRLDTAFTDLERDPDGRARVLMRGAGREVEVWLDAAFGHLMLFTGDTLRPEHRRQGLAIEPMTCPPNAFASGEDLITLRPGATASASWGVVTRSEGSRVGAPGSSPATD